MRRLLTFCLLSLAATPALAQGTMAAPTPVSTSWPAILMFCAIVLTTLGITFASARKTGSRSDFYSAGSGITPLQNGLAIAGDFLSAAAFLGISALVYTNGFDGMLYAIGFLTGWPILLFVMSERLRNLGRFTFSDAVSFRFRPGPTRIAAAIGTLVVVALYLVSQMIGAGKIIELLFGIPYFYAVTGVGVLMTIYVAVGGMHATTWVQITKASILLVGGTLMAMLILHRFHFNIGELLDGAAAAHPTGRAILTPGNLFAEPVSAISLGLALVFGTAGLPHILMRFFTVRDAASARKSVFFACCCVAYFCLIIPLLGFGAIAVLMNDPQFFHVDGAGSYDKIKDLIGGANMAAVHLSGALGGPLLLGLISAVAFATILAVVAGLTLAGASAISYDLYGQVFHKGSASEKSEVLVSRLAAVGIGVVAVILACGFENQNVAFMAGLALAAAASCNFPMLLAAIFWKSATTRGIVVGGLIGLISSVGLVVASKTVWVTVFHFQAPLFPYENPTLFTMPLAFALIYIVSFLDRSLAAQEERGRFAAQMVRSEIGELE
ncbi:cation acetate symporter (plasmid) [Sphingomonas panacis]|uniref:Cation acetate symporter n=1 Tax=Sphingomonas panacis TaxID=1560345 RepID=A0A1B3ZIB7_9SPHN|nr:cation/acetate symporter ActP [Sphingomonas panacis]AOH87169.1 cation acetate symporter [Sphingomonas panacis]